MFGSSQSQSIPGLAPNQVCPTFQHPWARVREAEPTPAKNLILSSGKMGHVGKTRAILTADTLFPLEHTL